MSNLNPKKYTTEDIKNIMQNMHEHYVKQKKSKIKKAKKLNTTNQTKDFH